MSIFQFDATNKNHVKAEVSWTDDDLLRAVSKNVLRLDASKCVNLTDKVIPLLDAPLLIDLNLSKTNLTSLQGVFPELKELELCGTSITDEGLAQLKAPKLLQLNLIGTKLTKVAVQKNCPNLKQIRLSVCREITDESVSLLGAPLRIENLSLDSTNITAVRGSFPALFELDLRECKNLTEEGLAHLDAPNLEKLLLSDTNLPKCAKGPKRVKAYLADIKVKYQSQTIGNGAEDAQATEIAIAKQKADDEALVKQKADNTAAAVAAEENVLEEAALSLELRKEYNACCLINYAKLAKYEELNKLRRKYQMEKSISQAKDCKRELEALAYASQGESGESMIKRLLALLGGISSHYDYLCENDDDVDEDVLELNLSYQEQIKEMISVLGGSIPSTQAPGPNRRNSIPASDRVTLLSPLSEAVSSSGKCLLLDGNFSHANTSESTFVKAKLFTGNKSWEEARREYNFMLTLHNNNELCFVKYFGLLKGSEGQILPYQSGNTTQDDAFKCNACACIVMERGEISLDRFLLDPPEQLSLHDLLAIAQRMLTMLISAHNNGIVLMDFKFSNIISVISKGLVQWKAIDFGSSCFFKEPVSNDVTVGYCSPELAKMLLRHAGGESTDTEQLLAHPKMDVMSFGFLIFELVNDMKSFWKMRSPPLFDNTDIIKATASLTDEEVQATINQTFPGDKFITLRTVLSHALKINPAQRASAHELQAHSLFGSKDPTLDGSSMKSWMDSMHRSISSEISDMHSDMSQEFTKVHLSLEEIKLKLEELLDTGDSMICFMRQLAIQDSENHKEIRQSFMEIDMVLKEGLEKMSSATSASSLSAEESDSETNVESMRSLMESVMSEAITRLNQNMAINNQELKQNMVDAIKQCSDTAANAHDCSQLNEIMTTLNSLQENVAGVVTEIAVIRGDIEKVNASLGSHNNMLRSLLNAEHNNPTLLIMLPPKPSLLSSFRGMFKKKMHLFFVCPVTKTTVPCGAKGEGLIIEVPTLMMKKIAPLVAVSFAVVGIALSVYGVPFPVPSLLPKNMSSQDLVNSVLSEMAVHVGETVVEETTTASAGQDDEDEEVFESVTELIEKCKVTDKMSSFKKKQVLSTIPLTMQAASQAAYPVMRQVLMDYEGKLKGGGGLERIKREGAAWVPSCTGLIKVTSKQDGTTAWVSENGRERFDSLGAEAIQPL